jgi:hypothetical protein
MTTDQLLDAVTQLLNDRRTFFRDELRNRFAFNRSVLWTDTTGAAWLRDDWGHLLPVPNVVSN